MKLHHVPDCDRCTLDDHECVSGGVWEGCFRKAFEKNLFETAVLVYLVAILVAAVVWPRLV